MYSNKSATAKLGLSGNALKIIAVCSMVIDHTGLMLDSALSYHLAYTGMPAQNSTAMATQLLLQCAFYMRLIGRIAFPIFCFLLVQGFLHTHSIKKYVLSMAAFALISEIPFNLLLNSHSASGINFLNKYNQNVFFTLTLGLICLCGIKHFKGKIILQLVCIALSCTIASYGNFDYDIFGILTIVIFYLLHSKAKLFILTVPWLMFGYSAIIFATAAIAQPSDITSALIYAVGSGCVQLLCVFSLIFINLYSGARGARLPKYFFYAFYPLHLLALYFIRYFIIEVIL